MSTQSKIKNETLSITTKGLIPMSKELNKQIEKMRKQGDKSKMQPNFGTWQPKREKNKVKSKQG